MKSFTQFSEELLSEKVLSIGLNPSHEKHREEYRNQIHDIMKKSYEPIGGYSGLGSGSKEESDAIHKDISDGIIKATKRDGKITSATIYKKQHGRKFIAIGTDGSDQGKKDFYKTSLEDHEQKRAWGEVSGAVEKIFHSKIGMPGIENTKIEKLIGKKVDPDENSRYHYNRTIGGHSHKKMGVGHPKTTENKDKSK